MKIKENKVRAWDVKKALAKYHNDPKKWSIFFEVKNGPTQLAKNLLIMDGLAIKKSWATPCFQGYEIKVSRADFLQDEKWPGYLDYCHKFYFVCPKGMISREEIENLDGNVGLMYYDPNYKNCGLHTIKAPAYSNIDMPPAEMLYYIIMSKLESDRYPFFSKKRDFFKKWLEVKKDNKKLGWELDGEIGKIIRDQQRKIDSIEKREKKLNKKHKVISEVLNYLQEKGLAKWSHKNFPLKDNWKEELDKILGNKFSKKDALKIKKAIKATKELEEVVK